MPDDGRRIVEVVQLEPLVVHRDQLLRMDAVEKLVGLKPTTIYELIALRRFPLAVQITERAVGWRASEVLDWIKERPIATVRRAAGRRP